MLLTVVICVDIDFCMFYDANIGERCETVRTWFDRGVNRLHRLHRLFSCQRKLLLPTDNTDNTKFFFSQQITLITQIIFLPTDSTNITDLICFIRFI